MSDNDFKGFVRASTGIEGLDYILGGGFPVNRMYLLEGDPGAGVQQRTKGVAKSGHGNKKSGSRHEVLERQRRRVRKTE